MQEERYGKFVIIGDIHAEDGILAGVLEYAAGISHDALLCVGDVVDGRGDCDRCCSLLSQNKVLTLRGNHDSWYLRDMMRDLREATQPGTLSAESEKYIASLPATLELKTTSGSLLLCHGIGHHEMAKLLPDDYGYALESNFELHEIIDRREYRFMVNGHTHRRMVRSFADLTVINAGTIKRDHDPCFAVVELYDREVRFYDLDGCAVKEKVSVFPL